MRAASDWPRPGPRWSSPTCSTRSRCRRPSAECSGSTTCREGVEAVVGLSQWLAQPDHPSLATRHNWLIDRLFADLPGVAHVVVNPGFFADNYLRGLIGMAAQLGVLTIPSGASRNAPPSNEDIARVVVATLLDPAAHAGATYRPTGPVLIDAQETAQVLTEVLGRRVRHVDLPVWAFMRALKVMGPRLASIHR